METIKFIDNPGHRFNSSGGQRYDVNVIHNISGLLAYGWKQHGRHCKYNLGLRRVRATTVAVEKQ